MSFSDTDAVYKQFTSDEGDVKERESRFDGPAAFSQDDGVDNDAATCDGEGEDDEVDGEPDTVAISLKGIRIGCAIFKPAECRIEVFEVTAQLSFEGGGADAATIPVSTWDAVPAGLLWFAQYLEAHRPTVILPHQVAATPLLHSLVKLVPGCGSVLLDSRTAFDPTRVPMLLATMYPEMDLQQLLTRFDHTCVAMMAAMAALLRYSNALRWNVCDIVQTGPMRLLCIAPQTAQLLQLVRTEAHPCDYQGIGYAKEGLSLFSVVDCTQSRPGRALLRQWFALPSCDAEEIRRRQAVVAFFASPERRDTLILLRRTLRRVHGTSRLFTLLRRGKASRATYRSLLHTIRGAITVYEVLKEMERVSDSSSSGSSGNGVVQSHFPLRGAADPFRVDRLRAMAERIEATVAGCGSTRTALAGPLNFDAYVSGAPAAAPAGLSSGEEGQVSGSISVPSSADPTGTLGVLRASFEDLRNALRQKAEDEFRVLTPAMRAVLCLRCLYVAQHGYLLCVQREGLATTGGLLPIAEHDINKETAEQDDEQHHYQRVLAFMETQYGWELHHEEVSGGEGQCYFKTRTMVELDNEVGDLRQRIRTREQELREGLDEYLLYHALHMLPPARVLSKLDCLLAFAYCAVQYQWCCPEVLSSCTGDQTCCCSSPSPSTPLQQHRHVILRLCNAWHPVLRRAVTLEALRPFSLVIERVRDRVCVFTGANGSGKSVLLGAIAHIVFLAQLGCFVPAEAASLTLFSGILVVSGVGADGGGGGVSIGGSSGSGIAQASSFAAECTALNRVMRFSEATQSSAEHTIQVTSNQVNSGGLCSTGGVPLILLDEFGRGTAPEDGRALLGSALRFFANVYPFNPRGRRSDSEREGSQRQQQQQQQQCIQELATPVVLCATHFMEMLLSPSGSLETYRSGGSRGHVEFGVENRDIDGFPFDQVLIFDMRCIPVFLEGSGVITDVVPTFEPYLLSNGDGRGECGGVEHGQHARTTALSGLFLAKESGVPATLLQHWQECIGVVSGGGQE